MPKLEDWRCMADAVGFIAVARNVTRFRLLRDRNRVYSIVFHLVQPVFPCNLRWPSSLRTRDFSPHPNPLPIFNHLR